MEKTNKITIISFLKWLSNRLIYKHFYSSDDEIISSINKICVILNEEYRCNIDDRSLDMILSQYYVDFFLDPSDDFKVGFSEKQRQELRIVTKQIVDNIINNRIPKESLIKKE